MLSFLPALSTCEAGKSNLQDYWMPLTHRLCNLKYSSMADMLKPFQCRPHLGTRIMVQANFSRMIRAIKSELMSWQSEIRIRTMQLLRSCLLLIEDYAEQWIVPLLDAVCQVRLVILEELYVFEMICDSIALLRVTL